MRMNDATGHLTYCLNVHPGETWSDCLGNIQTKAMAIREAICPVAPFGLGLRLSHRAAQALAVPQTLAQFRCYLAEQSLYAFTINGFPYGVFHGSPVKLCTELKLGASLAFRSVSMRPPPRSLSSE